MSLNFLELTVWFSADWLLSSKPPVITILAKGLFLLANECNSLRSKTIPGLLECVVVGIELFMLPPVSFS